MANEGDRAEGGDDRGYHHGRLKDALKAAALEVVAEQGEQKLTFRELARRTGVTHTAPYAHFRNKDALLASVAADGFRRLTRRIETAGETLGDDPLLRLAGVAEGYLTFASEDRAYHDIVFGRAESLDREDPDMAAADGETFAYVTELFAQAQEAGHVRKLPAEKLTVVLWAAILGCAEALRLGTAQRRGIEDRDELIHVLLDVLLGGLAPR